VGNPDPVENPDRVLSPDVVDLLERCVLGWLATVDPRGAPSVSPKEIFVAVPPRRILVAGIASPRSVRNITANGAACFAAVDVFDQRGVQLFGTAHVVHPDDPTFEHVAQPLAALAGPSFVIRQVIDITVHRLRPIIAPSYWARPELSDRQRRSAALAAYGVQQTDVVQEN
jgi:predicted pyridoxine 5'-phosphate oxidase superfamily flavin-nucleotide-binding protein